MTIETKFNVGDKVWYLDSYENVWRATITGFEINYDEGDDHIYIDYLLSDGGFANESKLFFDRDKLLLSL